VQADQKLRRSGPLTLDLEPTGDILREVVERCKPGMLVIGFAAETEDVLAHGRDKLLRKGADAIVLNDVSRAGVGFDSDRNAVTYLTQDRSIEMRRPRHMLAEADTDASLTSGD
jgi:phosphopantothenoylcysteine decarboxylase/phosphopantothenate--cysteine ligase